MPTYDDSVEIRVCSNQSGRFGSGESQTIYMPMPPMRTEYTNFTDKVAPAKNNVHEGYILEDYCSASDLPTYFKKVSSQSTNVASSSLMSSAPSNIQGARELFTSKSSGFSRAYNGAFDRDGINFRVKGPGTVALGTFKKSSGRLNTQKASWNCAVGVQFTWNTADWNVASSGNYKIQSVHLCYMTPGSNETFIAKCWDGGTYANTTNDDAGGGVKMGQDVRSTINKDSIAKGWNQKPYVSGNIFALISDDDIAVVSQGNYVTTGILIKLAGSNEAEFGIFDFRFLFDGVAETSTGSTNSLRVIEPPQLITEVYDRTKFLLAKAS